MVVFYQNTNADGVNNGKGWDTYANATVRYPAERPDAYLQLFAGSSFTANGSFGGFIQAENASVTLNGGTSCVTKETISTSGSYYQADTEFKEITTTAQLQKSFNGHKILFNFVKEGVTGYQISTAAELPTVQTAGLTFGGWYKNDLKITNLSEISEDAVLTAKWI